MSEFWLCFNCCIAEQPQPTLCTIASTFCLSLISYIRHTIGNNDVFTQDAPPRIMVNDKRRRRIDRSMIGEPTNFVHTAHVGSGDLFSGMNSVHSVQNQMQSKGGYGGEVTPVNMQMQLVDTKAG